MSCSEWRREVGLKKAVDMAIQSKLPDNFWAMVLEVLELITDEFEKQRESHALHCSTKTSIELAINNVSDEIRKNYIKDVSNLAIELSRLWAMLGNKSFRETLKEIMEYCNPDIPTIKNLTYFQ